MYASLRGRHGGFGASNVSEQRRHDRRDPIAELLADPRERRLAALVLGAVVQQRGDRLVFVAAVLEHETGDREQVRDVGHAAALAGLAARAADGFGDRGDEPIAQDHRGSSLTCVIIASLRRRPRDRGGRTDAARPDDASAAAFGLVGAGRRRGHDPLHEPDFYEPIVPQPLGPPARWVLGSGVVELAAAVLVRGAAHPPDRRPARRRDLRWRVPRQREGRTRRRDEASRPADELPCRRPGARLPLQAPLVIWALRVPAEPAELLRRTLAPGDAAASRPMQALRSFERARCVPNSGVLRRLQYNHHRPKTCCSYFGDDNDDDVGESRREHNRPGVRHALGRHRSRRSDRRSRVATIVLASGAFYCPRQVQIAPRRAGADLPTASPNVARPVEGWRRLVEPRKELIKYPTPGALETHIVTLWDQKSDDWYLLMQVPDYFEEIGVLFQTGALDMMFLRRMLGPIIVLLSGRRIAPSRRFANSKAAMATGDLQRTRAYSALRSSRNAWRRNSECPSRILARDPGAVPGEARELGTSSWLAHSARWFVETAVRILADVSFYYVVLRSRTREP